MELLGDCPLVNTNAIRRGRLLVLLVVFALAISGCTRTIDPAQVAGSWVYAGPRGETAELDLSSDGQATGRDVPGTVISGAGPVDWTHTYAFTGTWELSGGDQVGLTLDKLIVGDRVTYSVASTTLTAHIDGDSVSLSQTIGDPDNGNLVEFERK